MQEYPALVEGVVEQVEKRYRFSYQDTWAAAFLVDPINFIKTPGRSSVKFFWQLGLGIKRLC